MAFYTIPLPADGTRHFDFSVDLEDAVFVLEFYWNERAAAWFFTLKNADGEILVAGRRVVIGWPLLGSKTFVGRPAGDLLCLDSEGTDRDPTADDFGTRVQLYYSDGA